MADTFHKFPHTPHLLWLGHGTPRDDKVLPPAEVAAFLADEVLVEEKIDGANLGVSLDPSGQLRAQSRGNYLAQGQSHAQWNLLWPWLAQRKASLENGLKGGLILFGEWCYAKHSVPYDALPDWFLAFDIFEIPSRCFWSVERRNQWLKDRDIVPVPQVGRGRFQKNQLSSLLGISKVGHVPMEGIYLRREKAGRLEARAKVVSVAFKQAIQEHWTRRTLVPNHLAPINV